MASIIDPAARPTARPAVLGSRYLIQIEPVRRVRLQLGDWAPRPQTASGVIFATLEDEFGCSWWLARPGRAETARFLPSRMLRPNGHLEMADGVRHVIAWRLTFRSALLAGLNVGSRDFNETRCKSAAAPAYDNKLRNQQYKLIWVFPSLGEAGSCNTKGTYDFKGKER